jgi:hypothetical protein
MKDFFLEANPNPDRTGCPDEGTLQALAEGRLPTSNPARLHLASCSDCFAEFRGFKGDWEQMRRRRLQILGLALAACLVVASAFVLRNFSQRRLGRRVDAQIASVHTAKVRVDLFDSGTVRGASDAINALNRVSLPAAVVELSVVLPRFSEPGKYEILVSESQSGKGVIAEGSGTAIAGEGKVAFNVTLDLRSAKPGPYFLATLRGSDNGVYYYPVQISPVGK